MRRQTTLPDRANGGQVTDFEDDDPRSSDLVAAEYTAYAAVMPGACPYQVFQDRCMGWMC